MSLTEIIVLLKTSSFENYFLAIETGKKRIYLRSNFGKKI
jgi:hypothetical protein